jgi:hypothetical protein
MRSISVHGNPIVFVSLKPIYRKFLLESITDSIQEGKNCRDIEKSNLRITRTCFFPNGAESRVRNRNLSNLESRSLPAVILAMFIAIQIFADDRKGLYRLYFPLMHFSEIFQFRCFERNYTERQKKMLIENGFEARSAGSEQPRA